MKVSVVIPVYNEEKIIKNCLESLMKQTEKPSEIIVVDNNCADNTINVVKKYKNVKVIKEKKQGILYARNAGFNYATGDIIARTDADSITPRFWIKNMKKIFINNPPVVAFTTIVNFYDVPLINRMPFIYYVYTLIPKSVLGNYPLFGPSMALRKIVWDKVKKDICHKDKEIHEDIDLSFHIKKYGKTYLDSSLIMKASGRRLKYNPFSFFGEYIFRFFKMLKNH